MLGFIARTTHAIPAKRVARICQHTTVKGAYAPLWLAPLHASAQLPKPCVPPVPSQAGNERAAWRREEAPSRASPAGNQTTKQEGEPQLQGRKTQRRSSPRKLFSAGEGHPPTRRRRAGLSQNVAFQRKLSDFEPIISRILSKTWHVDQQTERRTQTESTRRPFPMATERIRQPFPIATTNQETRRASSRRTMKLPTCQLQVSRGG